MKTSKNELIKNPSKFEIETLKNICFENDCTMEILIDAIMNNVVSQEISMQIRYLKTGKLPGED